MTVDTLRPPLKLPKTYKPLEGDSFMIQFTNEIVGKEGYRPYYMFASPEKLPREIALLTDYDVPVVVASLLKPDEIWQTAGISQRFAALDLEFSPNPNEDENSSPVCVVVALYRLGFNVPIEKRMSYGTGFKQTKEISYGGHVMAVDRVDGTWSLEDQYGKLRFRNATDFNDVVASFAKFRLSVDPNASQGYCFEKK